ncbi:MAG: SH3 domain-containing protein [Rhizomicrobium sp.]
MPKFSSAAAIFTIVLLCAGAAAANPAHVRIAGPLQSQPALKAPATGAVKAGASVDIIERKGFWARVRGGAQTGWLKLGRLSLDSSGSGSEIVALASGRTGSNNVVSASGGRGLDAADFARATPDIAAVSALSRSAASEAAAGQFARSGRLKTRHIDYIREPKANARRGRP